MVKKIVWKIFFFLLILDIKGAYAMGNNDVQEYGIVLLPPQEIVAEAKRLNHIVATSLEGPHKENNYHVTLYHGRFLKDDLQKIYEKLNGIKIKDIQATQKQVAKSNALGAGSMGSFLEMTFSLPLILQNNQYVVWRIQKTDELQVLHETVLKTLLPYRQGKLQRCIDAYGDLNAKSKKQIDNYGVHGVLDDYDPHITLFYGEKPNDKMPSIMDKLKPGETFKSFQTNSLAIGKLGYHGNLTQILYVVNL